MPITNYRGFSTIEAERTRAWTLYDVELIRRDLLNHFHTRYGERVGRANFGCKIWDMLHENMTDGIRRAIIDEAVRICSADPRVALHEVKVYDFPNGVRVEIILDYLGLAAFQNFNVLFEIEQKNAFNPPI